MAFCENCGVQLSDQEKFCHNCGTQITRQEQSKTNPPASVTENKPKVQQTPPAYTQTPVSQPKNNIYAEQENRRLTVPLSVGQFLITLILLILPIVNIILLFVWSFGSDVNLNKKNFARATLIIGVIMIILSFIMGSVIMSIFTQLMNGFSY
jgi:hypothetical protein